jgi:F0F1-type ATP synthase assembly protein I
MAKEPPMSGKPSTLRQLTALAGAGVQFAVTVALSTTVGWWIDEQLGWSPWMLMIGALLGAVGAFYQLCRTLLKDNKPDHNRHKERE